MAKALENIVDIDFLVQVDATAPPIPNDTDSEIVLEFPQVFEIEMPLKSGLGFLDEGETVAQECEVVDVNYENFEGSPSSTNENRDITCVMTDES